MTLYNSWEPWPGKRVCTTGADGAYEFDSLPYSPAYWLIIEVKGFVRYDQGAGKVNNDQTSRVDVVLHKQRLTK